MSRLEDDKSPGDGITIFLVSGISLAWPWDKNGLNKFRKHKIQLRFRI